jgi:hypothetical protein
MNRVDLKIIKAIENPVFYVVSWFKFHFQCRFSWQSWRVPKRRAEPKVLGLWPFGSDVAPEPGDEATHDADLTN